MKIKIGPYLPWWGPYQIFGLLTKIGISEDRTDEWAKNSPEWFINLCQWVYDKRKRTVKIHIDKYDVWNMNNTLAEIIVPMLKMLKDTKHGVPQMDVMNQTSNSSQGSFDFYAEGDNDAFNCGVLQWEEIMDKMIFSFESMIKDDPDFWIVKPELDMTKYPEDEGKMCVPVRWHVEGKYDTKAATEHFYKVREGCELFGRYYPSLWD